MQEIFFHIEGDTVIKETHLPEVDGYTYQAEPVIDKETFIECYKRWIPGGDQYNPVQKMCEDQNKAIVAAVCQTVGYNIDGAELAKALKKYDRDQYDKGFRDAQPKWIPVSERLPESSGVYIVTREFNDGFECADLTDACYFDGTGTWHNDNRINHGRAYVDKKIKAWMPLPEPYKEGEKE